MTDKDLMVQKIQDGMEKKRKNYIIARSKKTCKVLQQFLISQGWDGQNMDDAIRLMKDHAICYGLKGEVSIVRKK